MSSNAYSASGFDADAVAQMLFPLEGFGPADTVATAAPVHTPRPNLPTQTAPDTTVPKTGSTGSEDPRDALLPPSLTDLGNAQLFASREGRSFRYVDGIGWLVWDTYRWNRREGESRAKWAAAHMGQALSDADPRGLFTSADLRKHKRNAMSNSGIRNMLALAQSSPDLRLDPEQLDSGSLVLCTPAGIVDLRHATLRPADPARDFHSRATAVSPAPMPTPRWHGFLEQSFGEDDEGREMIGYLQRLLGYAITGDTGAQILPFLYGKGSNGKSVLVNVLRQLLGDYADAAPPGFLMERQFSEHSTELTELQGRRIIICSELNQDDKFDEARVKLLTGQDNIKARRMRQDYAVSFRPTHCLLLVGNHRPSVRNGGFAFWRRIRLIPLERVVPNNKKIDNLDRILVEEEGPGILMWLIQGAALYLQNRDSLMGPARVQVATDGYEADENFVGRFMKECCVTSSDRRTEQGLLYQAYCAWSEEEDAPVVTSRDFAKRMRAELGLASPKDMPKANGARYYPSVGLEERYEAAGAARLNAFRATQGRR